MSENEAGSRTGGSQSIPDPRPDGSDTGPSRRKSAGDGCSPPFAAAGGELLRDSRLGGFDDLRAADTPASVRRSLDKLSTLCNLFERDSCAITQPGAGSAEVSRGELERFCRFLSHEIRNRVNVADITLQVLGLRLEGADRASVVQLHHLMQDFGSLARDLYALTVNATEAETMPLVRILEATVGSFEQAARDRQIEIVLADHLPDCRVDGGRIRLIVGNLVSNAIKFFDPEKVERWVRIEATLSERRLWIEVADNGIGLSMADRERIGRASREARGPGGLGLLICHEAAHQLGSRLWLGSEPGEGTRIVFGVLLRGEDGAAQPDRPPAPRSRV